MSRSAPSRSPVSASPTGSCFVCWSAMERRRPAPGRKGDALGADAGGCWRPVPWDANPCWLSQPRSGSRPARRGRRETARRRGGTTRRAARREAVPWVHWEPGDLPPARWRGYPNDVQANRPDPRAEGAYRDARTWSVASGAASTTSNRPMVVMGDSPDGVLEPHVGHPVVRFDGGRGPASKRGGSRLEAGIGRTWRTVPDRLTTNSRAAVAL